MNVLFIGGPLDGEFIDFEEDARGLPSVFVAASEDAVGSLSTEILEKAEQGEVPKVPGVSAYRLCVLATGRKLSSPIPVYALDGVNVMAALISGYTARHFDA